MDHYLFRTLTKTTCLQWVLLPLLLTATFSSLALSALAQTPPAVPQPPANDTAVPIQTKAEQFIDLLFAHRYSEALLYVHPTLREDLTKDDNIVNDVQEFQELAGGFKQRLDSRTDSNLVLVNAEFEALTDTIVVIFDEQGQITGFDFPEEPLRSIHRERILNK